MAVRPDPQPVHVLARVQVAVLDAQDGARVFERGRRRDGRERRQRRGLDVLVGERLERDRHAGQRADPRSPDAGGADHDVGRELAAVGDDGRHPAALGADVRHGLLAEEPGAGLGRPAGLRLARADGLGEAVGRDEIPAQHDLAVEERPGGHGLVGVEQPAGDAPRLRQPVAPPQVEQPFRRERDLEPAHLPEAPLPVEFQRAELLDGVTGELGHGLRAVGLEDEPGGMRGRPAGREQAALVEHRDVGPAARRELVRERASDDARPR